MYTYLGIPILSIPILSIPTYSAIHIPYTYIPTYTPTHLHIHMLQDAKQAPMLGPNCYLQVRRTPIQSEISKICVRRVITLGTLASPSPVQAAGYYRYSILSLPFVHPIIPRLTRSSRTRKRRCRRRPSTGTTYHEQQASSVSVSATVFASCRYPAVCLPTS